MFFIRPINQSDLDALENLAKCSGLGMTSLPADREILEKKISNSISSFSSLDRHNTSGYYLLVIEDLSSRELVGVSAIYQQVGIDAPFYSYEIKQARHISKELCIDKIIPFLLIHQENFGPSLIGTLFIDPKYRQLKLGKQISLSRFLYMADNLEKFQKKTIAEMRGVIENGSSPFWQATIRHFVDLEFSQADYLSAIDKSFIADLMPKHPIYIPLLDYSVQEIIGKVHPETRKALEFLEEQGFERDAHVDIFDAGPRVSVQTKSIKAINESFLISAKDLDIKKSFLVSNRKNNMDFRVINPKTKNFMDILQVNPEDIIRAYPL